MITLCHGEMNCGKTTTLAAHYRASGKGDGYIAEKLMEGNRVMGYRAVRLSTGEGFMLAWHQDFMPPDFTYTYQLGPYRFSKEAFDLIEKEMLLMADERTTPLYLDEAGRLELSQKGYCNLLKELLKRDVELILCIRTELIQDITAYFDMKNYELWQICEVRK